MTWKSDLYSGPKGEKWKRIQAYFLLIYTSYAYVERQLRCIFIDVLVQTEKQSSFLMQQILFPIQIWKSVKHDNINSGIHDLP